MTIFLIILAVWLGFGILSIWVIAEQDKEVHLQCVVMSLLFGAWMFFWIVFNCGDEVVLWRKKK